MDASVVASGGGRFLLSTTDYFYPLVDDPYVQGRIACCNVLSDLYAMGVTTVDTMLMILSVCQAMDEAAQDVVTRLMIAGFSDQAHDADTTVTGGQTIINPAPIIGGVAMSSLAEHEFIRPKHAVPGDVVVLTKPLGTQVAVNLHEWLRQPARWQRVEGVISREAAEAAYQQAMAAMARLNKVGAELMHTHGAHGATDVTGFGVLGHLRNLAESMDAAVTLRLHTLPCIANMAAVDAHLDHYFKLRQGLSAETSGGLMVCLPSQAAAEAFCADIEAREGLPAWIIGDVVEGANDAVIMDDAVVIEV